MPPCHSSPCFLGLIPLLEAEVQPSWVLLSLGHRRGGSHHALSAGIPRVSFLGSRSPLLQLVMEFGVWPWQLHGRNLCGLTWGCGVLSQELQACLRVTLTGDIGYLIRGKSSSTGYCGDNDRAVLRPLVGTWDCRASCTNPPCEGTLELSDPRWPHSL